MSQNPLTSNIFIFALLSILTLGNTQAQEGLYAPEAPADAAFVRIIHAAPTLAPINPSIDGISFPQIGYQSATPYQIVSEGTVEASFAPQLEQQLELTKSNFYTVALVGEENRTRVVVLQDPINTNLAQSLLVLYNFSNTSSVDMRTADGSQPVITSVEPHALGSVAVNPIQVDLASFSGEDRLSVFAELKLERGAAYSMIVMEGTGALTATWVANYTQN